MKLLKSVAENFTKAVDFVVEKKQKNCAGKPD